MGKHVYAVETKYLNPVVEPQQIGMAVADELAEMLGGHRVPYRKKCDWGYCVIEPVTQEKLAKVKGVNGSMQFVVPGHFKKQKIIDVLGVRRCHVSVVV